jgi:hypothetical protein
MMATGFGRFAVVGVLGLALTACNGRDDAPAAGDTREQMPMGQHEGMGGMQGMEGMHMDPEMMQRHAREMDEATSRMRTHIEEMRQLSSDQQHERMGAHVTEVSRMLNLVNRQMGEMDMGMGMGDEHMGQMMGMSGEEHRRMTEEMQAIRSDVEALQVASQAEVRARMPDHLSRLERMVGRMEQSAEHMRAM